MGRPSSRAISASIRPGTCALRSSCAPGTGPRRVGRIVQRLCEIETYRAMSMLGLMRARELTARLNALDPQLSALVVGAGQRRAPRPRRRCTNLLTISAELESLAVQFSFRFGATAAYEAIVNQRIEVLREERIAGPPDLCRVHDAPL